MDSLNSYSTEAETEKILDNTVTPDNQSKLGFLLAKIGLEAGGVEFEIERDQSATEPLSFE